MAVVDPPNQPGSETDTSSSGSGHTKDEVALDLMKFIAVTTGYGRPQSGAGFSGKPGGRTAEEHADALIELFERCRKVVNQ